MRVDVNLQDVDIDQCSSDGWFAGTHRCNSTTMEVSGPALPGWFFEGVEVLKNQHLCLSVWDGPPRRVSLPSRDRDAPVVPGRDSFFLFVCFF